MLNIATPLTTIPRHGKSRLRRSSGVALVLTLLVVAMLTVVVVSFNAVTRTEQAAARNYTKHGVGLGLVADAEAQAMLLLQSVLTNTNSFLSTQPGRAFFEDGDGALQKVELSSASLASEGASMVNMNVRISAGSGVNQTNWSVISSNANNYFFVPWINVVDSDGRITSRYAFWIDDNGSRLNLNYAGTNERSSFYPTNHRPIDSMQLLFGNDAASAASNRAVFVNNDRGFAAALRHSGVPTMTTNRSPHTPTWGYFFLPEQIRSFGATNANQAINRRFAQGLFNALQWQVGAGPGNLTNSAPNLGPSRFNLNQGAFLTGGGGGLLQQVDAFITTTLEAETVRERFQGSFTDKYGIDILRQIAVNINDYTLPTGSAEEGGQTSVTGAELADASGIPTTVAGHRPFPYLNEIVYGVGYTTNGLDDWSAAELQIWIALEIANPYPDPWGLLGMLRIEEWGGLSSVVVEYQTDDGPEIAEFQTSPWQSFASERLNIYVNNNLPAKSFAINDGGEGSPLCYVFEWQVEKSKLPEGASNVVVKSVTVEPGIITWRQWYDDPATIRDWAIAADFPAEHFVFDEVPELPNDAVQSGNYGQRLPPGGIVDFFGTLSARGIAKNDPRVRTFSAYSAPEPAWYEVGGGGSPITLGSNNSTVNMTGGTGLAGVLNDSPPPSGNIIDHPDFDVQLTSRLTERPFLSVFELGRVHTGLQWRTLQLHSQSASEGGQVPDWALIDQFVVSNARVPVATRLNVNSLPYPALTNWSNLGVSVAEGLSRAGSYAGLISGFTAANSPSTAQMLFDNVLTNARLSAVSSSVFTTNEARAVGENVATLQFATHWASRREGLPLFPRGAFGSLAEIVEVRGVSDQDIPKASKEQRGRVLYESLASHSGNFTIYSVAEVREVLPDGQIDILGEVRTRTQVTFNPTSGRVEAVVRTPIVLPD